MRRKIKSIVIKIVNLFFAHAFEPHTYETINDGHNLKFYVCTKCGKIVYSLPRKKCN